MGFQRVLTALALAGALLAPGAALAADDGKAVFEQSKCTRCHSAPGVKGGKTSLDGVGKRHDAAWIAKFIQKEIENADSKKHKTKFKGTDAELDALVKWLASLK